jgi:hypothetical protein
MLKNRIEADDPHTRSVLKCWVMAAVGLGLMAVGPYVLPANYADILPIFGPLFWAFSWTWAVVGALLFIQGLAVIFLDRGDFYRATVVAARIWFLRIVILTGYIFALYVCAIGSVWLSLPVFR